MPAGRFGGPDRSLSVMAGRVPAICASSAGARAETGNDVDGRHAHTLGRAKGPARGAGHDPGNDQSRYVSVYGATPGHDDGKTHLLPSPPYPDAHGDTPGHEEGG